MRVWDPDPRGLLPGLWFCSGYRLWMISPGLSRMASLSCNTGDRNAVPCVLRASRARVQCLANDPSEQRCCCVRNCEHSALAPLPSITSRVRVHLCSSLQVCRLHDTRVHGPANKIRVGAPETSGKFRPVTNSNFSAWKSLESTDKFHMTKKR